MTRRLTALALAAAGPLLAQEPASQPPANPPTGRLPAPASAGVGNANLGIQSFPVTGGQIAPQQQYTPAPVLSPYLNLGRGGILNRNAAVDYYNFVRPFTTGPAGYAPLGVNGMMPNVGRGGVSVGPDVVLEPDTTLRPAGSAAGFMTYGGYFNRLGTIGVGGPRAGTATGAGRTPTVPNVPTRRF